LHTYRYCVSSALFTCSSPIQYLTVHRFFLHLSFSQAAFSSRVFVLWSEDRKSSRQARRSSQRTLSLSLHLTFRRFQEPEPRSLEERSTKYHLSVPVYLRIVLGSISLSLLHYRCILHAISAQSLYHREILEQQAHTHWMSRANIVSWPTLSSSYPDSNSRQQVWRWTSSTKKLLAKVSCSCLHQTTLSNTRTGPARRYNLQKCRKELEKSCSDYQSRGSFPPTPQSTPCANRAAPRNQPAARQEKRASFQQSRPLNESAHASHRIKRYPFQYNEEELRQRAHVIKTESNRPFRLRLDQPPVSTSDPFDGRTSHDLSNNGHNEDSDTKRFTPRRHPTLHRQNLTEEEFVAIRDTAARLAKHCAVRDEQPYPDPTAQEALHRIRSSIWLERTKNECPTSAGPAHADEVQDDNGISITEDGCIIQRGFDVSPMASSPVDTVLERCDSGIGDPCRTPDHASSTPKPRQEPLRPNVRNSRGTRVPVCFRKQEIIHQRKVSHLSTLISGHSGQPKQQGITLEDADQARMRQQRRVPISVHPLVFLSESSSSGAIVSDSEDDSDGEQEVCQDVQNDSTTSSTVCADEAKGMASAGHGSVASPVVSSRPAETVKTSSPLPQHSAQLSPPSSKLPVLSPPRVEPVQPLHPGTPLPRRLSKHLNPLSERQGQALDRPSPLEQDTTRSQFLRSQQTAKVFLAHQRRRHAQRPPAPRAQSPCQALGLRLPSPQILPDNCIKNESCVSALLDKIEKNGGKRTANFSWDYVAPMHGFSSCSTLYVLD